MKERKAVRPPVEYVHSELMNRLNNAAICIKLHHLIDEKNTDAESLLIARGNNPQPSYQEIVNLLEESYTALSKETTSPIKY